MRRIEENHQGLARCLFRKLCETTFFLVKQNENWQLDAVMGLKINPCGTPIDEKDLRMLRNVFAVETLAGDKRKKLGKYGFKVCVR